MTVFSRDRLQEWYRLIAYMLSELLVWLNKASKHQAAGYPLVTQLMCIAAQDETFSQKSMDDLVSQRLHKLIREKVVFNDAGQRTLGLSCIVQVVCSHMQHNAGIVSEAELTAKADSYLGPVITAARRGSLLAPDQLELLRDLCKQSMERAPAYTLLRLLPDFLGMELWEMVLVGLRSAMAIMLDAPLRVSLTTSSVRFLYSVAATAEIPLSSPQKMFIFIIQKSSCWVKVSKNQII